MFHVVFYRPEIPPNTGNAIRMVATTGATLHLVGPLGFTLDEPRLRRAGLDYHDLARVHVHDDLEAAWTALAAGGEGGALGRVFAFSTAATTRYTDVAYRPGDVLLFGPESVGLPPEVQHAPQVTDRVRVPMVPGRRSLNLSNTAAVAVHEAWRQHGFTGGE